MNLEIKRALFHVVTTIALAVLVMEILGPMALLVSLVAVLLVENERRNYQEFQEYLVKRAGDYMSEDEKKFPPKCFSILPMLLGFMVLVAFLSRHQFYFVVGTIALGDPLARVLGKLFGKTLKLPWELKKSWVGFTVMWAVGAVLGSLSGLAPIAVILVPFVMSLAESLGSREKWYRDDNLLIQVFGTVALLASKLIV